MIPHYVRQVMQFIYNEIKNSVTGIYESVFKGLTSE